MTIMEIKDHRCNLCHIQVIGYTGKAVVVVSCVTNEAPYKSHPHNLVGKEGCKKGVCTIHMNDDMTASFPNLGIQCVKKKDIDESLTLRQQIRVDPFQCRLKNTSRTLIRFAVILQF